MTSKSSHDQDPVPESVPTAIALHELTDNPDLYIFGHGTPGSANARAMLRDGLRLRKPDLWSTVMGMKSAVDDPEAAQENAGLLESWPHKNHRFVVMLGIERLRGDEIPHRRYLQSVVQPRAEVSEGDREYGEPYSVDGRFVAGYFDVDADTFTRNPDFDSRYDPRLLETTADLDIVLERNRPPAMAHIIGRTAVTPGTEMPSEPLPANHNEDPNVW